MDISSKNYFEIFSLTESFQIDADTLDQNYKKLQSEYHPDKYVNAGDRERRLALQYTSILNEAFETLKSPLKRSSYLLILHDIDPEENNQSHLGQEFLFRQIQLRENLEDIAAKQSLSELGLLKAEVNNGIEKYLEEFESYYQAGQYSSAKPVYSRLQFLYKLISEINGIEEKLLDY